MSSDFTFVVEENVPLAQVKKNRVKSYTLYPFYDMPVNSSFFVPSRVRSFLTIRKHIREFIKSVAEDLGIYPHQVDLKFKTRVVEENGVKGVRVWRVE